MKPRSIACLILLALGTSFTTIGIVLGLLIGKPIVDQANASEQWPQTQGEILVSEVVESHGDDGTMYSAHVVYKYTLDGGDLESDRVWFGGDYSTSDRSEMSEVVRKYPVGQTVDVYYSSDDPTEAVLMPGAYTSTYVLFVIGMVFLVIGAVLLLILIFMFARSFAGLQSDESEFHDPGFNDVEQHQL